MLLSRETVYFCDFDGTIALKDIGNELHKRFSAPQWRTTNRAYRSGRISSRDCLSGQYEFFRGRREEIEAFVLEHEIDPTFAEFAGWTRRQERPLIILSDGLDFYIHLLLDKCGVGGVSCFSNHAQFEGDRVRVSFPHFRHDCPHGCQCGNCKPSHMWPYEGYRRVFIGDGISDRLAARTAEVVYAKRHLAKYCEEDGRPFILFEQFRDIIRFEEDTALKMAVAE